MRPSGKSFANVLVSFALVLAALKAFGSGVPLRVEMLPMFEGTPLRFDAVTNLTAAGQRVSVTRLDFLVSDLALRCTDGTWVAFTNTYGCLRLRDRRTSFDLENVPAREYDALRFQVGLAPALNHQDPSQYAADHPLNPEVNGLHWGWMGGYVFFALEGRWSNAGAPADQASAAGGYSYHLATDAQLMTVQLPVNLDLLAGQKLVLALNAERIFNAPNRIVLGGALVSTHSRTNDGLAGQLRQNVELAFSVSEIAPLIPPLAALAPTHNVEVAPTAKPYRLTISQFFPRPSLPLDNPLTEEGVALGRRLFFDPQLSANNAQSCSSCHEPSAAFAQGKAVSSGAEGQAGRRNAMALFNLAWKSSYFWDGRAATLRQQVLMPIQNAIEMHESLTNVVAKLSRQMPENSEPPPAGGYPAWFRRAFGTPEITADRIARALEQFLLTLTAYDSKFDRVLRGQAQFTRAEQRGFELFHTEYDPRRQQFGADCFHCHGGPLLQSQAFANNGLDSEFKDLGRYEATKRDGDQGKFAVPSLRNVALSAPYMHDGRFKTLEEVVAHYTTGLKRSATLDPNLAKHPNGGVPLSTPDQQALVAFLKTLTEEPPGSEGNESRTNFVPRQNGG